MNMKQLQLTLAIASLITLSCDAPEARLLDEDAEASATRLRRMNITAEESDGQGGWTRFEAEQDIFTVSGWVAEHCRFQAGQSPSLALCDNTPSDPCADFVCTAHSNLCGAIKFRELAAAIAPITLMTVNGSPAFRIPPQDAESRAALEQVAMGFALASVEQIDLALHDMNACDSARMSDLVGVQESGATPEPVTLDQNVGEFLASTLVEALQVGEDAAQSASDLSIGLADRDRGATSNRGRAARISWFDRNLSRLVAMQLQTGGLVLPDAGDIPVEAGQYGQDTNSPAYLALADVGIGSQAPCTGACASALTFLRFSGAPIADIAADEESVSLNNLISGEVSPRLAVRLNRPSISAYDEGALAQEIGVPVSALAEARSWMRHEAATYARPSGLTAPIPTLMPTINGSPRSAPMGMTFDRATMADPEPPPAMHYISAGRAGVLWSDDFAQPGVQLANSIEPLKRPERAYLFDLAHTLAREAIATARLDARGTGIVATIVQDAVARRAARTEVCSRTLGGNAYRWRIRTFGVPAGELALVEGSTNLRCAVDGDVEGEPCVLASPTTVTSGPTPGTVQVNGATAYHTGWPHFVEWTIDQSGTTLNRPFWYVVRLRRGRDPGPGAYEAIAGIPWELPTDTGSWWDTCTTIPFDGLSAFAAGTLFAQGPDLTPPRTCAGQDLNGPIPLEDEIIDDLDPYETSWRHHLNVASRAAQHSDQLARDLLASGLEMDLRSESAVNDLVEACGVSTNLDNLFNAEGEDGQIRLDDLVVTPMTPCDDETNSGCDTGYQCVGAVCVASVLMPAGSTSFEQEALLACLGLDHAGNRPIVALGSQRLCAWYDPNAPEVLCAGASAGECPFPVPESDDCGEGPTVNGEQQEMVMVSDRLELFDSLSPDAEITGQVSATRLDNCGFHVRSLRERTSAAAPSNAAFEAIVQSSFFSYESVRYWADRIGWRGYPRDYSEFTLDGAPWMGPGYGGTGYPFASQGRDVGPASQFEWPCGEPLPIAHFGHCAGPNRSLFCSTVGDCTIPSQRAAFNRRMGRAAATLGALSGVGLSQLWMPVHYEDLAVSSGSSPGFATMTDEDGNAWNVAPAIEFGDVALSGMIVVPGFGDLPGAGDIVWTSQASSDIEIHGVDVEANQVSFLSPFGFVNLGARFENDDEERARTIARQLWAGLTPTPLSNYGVRYINFQTQTIAPTLDGVGCTVSGDSECDVVDQYAVFRRALLNGPRNSESAVYLEGRQAHGSFDDISHLFNASGYHASAFAAHTNRAHLFEDDNDPGDYGDDITQRDLLDAMELMCEVADTVPPNSIPECGDGPPPVYSMADIGIVQSHMRCVAARLDAVAQRQVVQNIPEDVYNDLRGEATDARPEIGGYGDLIIELRRVLRAQAAAPRQIASQLRGAADDIELLKSQMRSLDRQKVITWLSELSQVIGIIATCASGNFGAACGTAAAQLAIGLAITDLTVANIGESERQAFIDFRGAMDARVNALVGLEEALNDGSDSVESVLARLRATRMNAQSAVARAAFALRCRRASLPGEHRHAPDVQHQPLSVPRCPLLASSVLEGSTRDVAHAA
jgi:hypothetical protein